MKEALSRSEALMARHAEEMKALSKRPPSRNVIGLDALRSVKPIILNG